MHLTQFSQTGMLGVCHSLLNTWAPKSTHVSYKGMVTRFKLAKIDFNQNENLKQTKTKDGVNRLDVSFSKMTKTWAVTPIKEAKDALFFSS